MLGNRRCDEGHLQSMMQDPLLHGTSPWLISEVAAVANVGNTLDFSLEVGHHPHLFPDPSPPGSEDTAENNLL